MKNVLMTKITSNEQARTIAPKGTEGVYINYDADLGLTKVGRSANLEHDYRAATRFMAEGTIIGYVVTGDKSVSKDIEALCKEAHHMDNRRKHSGAQGETYRLDGNVILKWLMAL